MRRILGSEGLRRAWSQVLAVARPEYRRTHYASLRSLRPAHLHNYDSDERCVALRALPSQCLLKPCSATLCGINCPFAVFGLAMPLFLWWRGGAQLHKERDLSLVTRFADSYTTYGVATLPLSHVDN